MLGCRTNDARDLCYVCSNDFDHRIPAANYLPSLNHYPLRGAPEGGMCILAPVQKVHPEGGYTSKTAHKLHQEGGYTSKTVQNLHQEGGGTYQTI